MTFNELTQRKIEQFLSHARQAISTGRLVMVHGDHIAAVNRAYYAIFYAANALLATRGLERSKHSGVIAAFRQHFARPGSSRRNTVDFTVKQWSNETLAIMAWFRPIRLRLIGVLPMPNVLFSALSRLSAI